MTNRDLDRIRFVTRNFTGLQGLRMLVPIGMFQIAAGVVGGLGVVPRLLPWVILLQVAAWGAAFFLVFRSRSYYRSLGHVEPQRGAAFPRDPALSIFSPAGPAPTPVLASGPPPLGRQMRQFFLPLGLILAVLVSLHAIGPRVELLTDGWALDPWLQLTPPVVIKTDSAVSADMNRYPWFRIEETKRVVNLFQTQGMYAVWGSFLLSVWLMRGRRRSQAYYLALALPLLGLAALGASLEVVQQPAVFSYALLALAHTWIAQLLQGSALVIAGVLDHRQLVRAFGARPPVPALRAV